MSSVLHSLPRTALERLAVALKSGRLSCPYQPLSLSETLAVNDLARVAWELNRLTDLGFTPQHLSVVMELLATERARQQAEQDRLQMVWTGPDQDSRTARDTSVVVGELLSQASKSLLITTFSLSRDARTFEPVGLAMQRNPDLEVVMVVHVDMSRQNVYGGEAIEAFAREFWSTKWPWTVRPRVFFDPRGVQSDPMGRALQHAKCIVVDLERVLVTSANYTESGHLRNVELGIVVRDHDLASRVDSQFRKLIADGFLQRLPGCH